MVERLRAAFLNAATRPWFGEYAGPLQLAGFEPVKTATYAPMLAWDREARSADYNQPA
jgi:hypothetical protein